MQPNTSHGFSMIELVSTIVLLVLLVGGVGILVVSYRTFTQTLSDQQTYDTLNKALEVYKMNGGSRSALTSGKPIGSLLTTLKTPIVAYGRTYQPIPSNANFFARSISAIDSGSRYRISRYHTYTGEAGGTSPYISSGLVGHWRMDSSDISGSTLTDVSGTGNNATLIASPSTTTGKIGQALALNGSNQYVSVANASSLNMGASQDFTVMAWVRSTQAAVVSYWPIILAKDTNSGGTRMSYALSLHDQLEVRWFFQIYCNGVSYLRYGASNIADGNWHHIVGMRSGSTISTYQDGVFVGSTAATSASISNTVALQFGRLTPTHSMWLNGSIDDIRIYNRALSAGEILAIYNGD